MPVQDFKLHQLPNARFLQVISVYTHEGDLNILGCWPVFCGVLTNAIWVPTGVTPVTQQTATPSV